MDAEPYPTLTNAIVDATDDGTADLAGLRPMRVQNSTFKLANGRTVEVLDGMLEGSGVGERALLLVTTGQQVGGGSPPTELRGERYRLPAAVTVERGSVVPAPARGFPEGQRRRRPAGRLIAGLSR